MYMISMINAQHETININAFLLQDSEMIIKHNTTNKKCMIVAIIMLNNSLRLFFIIHFI